MRTVLRSALREALKPTARALAYLRPGSRILMYHRVDRLGAFDQLTVSPERFAEHAAHLAATGSVASLDSIVESLRLNRSEALVALTFDDGYVDNLTHAWPVLRRLALPATIFVTTAFCDQRARHPRYAYTTGALHLSWSQLRELAADPLITIGSHSVTHPFLSRLGDAEAFDEILRSRDRIESQLGQPVRYFCYPSGDCTQREVDLVRRAGYEAAVTVAPGVNRPGVDLYRLRRTEVTDRDSVADLDAKLLGAFDPLHLLLHWRREVRFAAARQGN